MRTIYSIKNSISSFITNIITFIFLFIGQTILIKKMGIEYNGLNGLFTNILTILNLFELGIGNAITYILYKYIKQNNQETIKSIMKFYKKAYNYIALFILVIGMLIVPFLKYIINEIKIDINIYAVYILFLLSTVSTYVLSYKRNLIFANQKKYILNIIHIIYIIILNVGQVIIIYLTKNFYLYLILKIICNIIENIVISIKTNNLYPYIKEKNINKIDNEIKNNIILRVKALIIHKTSTAVTNGTDNILISTFFGISTVGLYASYNYIISASKTLFKDLISSTAASVGNLLVEKDYKKNYSIFKRINLLNYWITVVTATCLLFLIEPFITIWLGKKYLLKTIVLVVLILNYFQSMMRSTFIVFKDSAGIWIEDKFIPLIQLSLNLVSSIICLKLFGLCGVFIGTIISSFVVWFYSYPKYVYKQLFHKKYKEYIINVIKFLVLFIIIETTLYLIIIFINVNNILLTLIIRLFICLVISNLVLYIINYKKNEYKYFIEIVKKVLKR